MSISKIWYDILVCHVQFQKKLLKNDQELKITFQNMPLLNDLQYQYCPKTYNGPNQLYNLQTRIVQFKDEKKAEIVHNS